MNEKKDTFEILAEEITLIRQDIERLQRTSLDRIEAEALHKEMAESVQEMSKLSTGVQNAIEKRLGTVAATLRQDAIKASASAAESAIMESHAKSLEAARSLSEAAGEARREAWRRFGGFWVWLVSTGALGALLGALTVFWLQGRADAKAFGNHPRIYCSSAGGEVFSQKNGSRFCAFQISAPTDSIE